MTLVQEWTLDIGQPWKRIVAVKDRRTRRLLRPDSVAGAIKTDAYGGLLPFTCTVTSEGSIAIQLADTDTMGMAAGTYEFDVVAHIPVSWPSASSYEYRKVIEGTITFKSYSTITYGDEDTTNMELRMTVGEDYTRPIVWNDDAGVLQTIQGAYLQADNGSDVAVVDLRYYTSVPNDAAIIAMPGAQKGYILQGALPGETACTLTIRIDHRNSVTAGTYPFDLFVKDGAGDWLRLVKGTLVVQPATSENPSP